jgi:hypothetical protein
MLPGCLAHSKAPTVSSPAKDREEAALDAWYLKSDKAAGYIYLAVEENQKIHFAMISDYPVKMWAAHCCTPLLDIHTSWTIGK